MTKYLSLALLLIAFNAHAEVVIKPGDPALRADLIKESHDFYRNVTTDSSGKILYDFMMESTTSIDVAAQRITFSRFRQIPFGSYSIDVSVTDLSLRPISMRDDRPQRASSCVMQFQDTEVIVKTTRKGVEATKRYAMTKGYFEDNSIGYILGYLDLKPGVKYVLDNFNKDTAAPSDPYTIEYAFDDVWELAADHRMECTVFHFTHGDATGHVWIEKATHQKVKTIGVTKNGTRFVVTKQ